MSSNKIFGYVLILIGLAIIIIALWQSYQIFTNRAEVPQIFIAPKQAQTPSKSTSGQIQDVIQNELSKMLQVDSIFKLLNLISWAVLAGILILGGGQIAGIGVKLATSKESSPAV